jgi:hypothetical protein
MSDLSKALDGAEGDASARLAPDLASPGPSQRDLKEAERTLRNVLERMQEQARAGQGGGWRSEAAAARQGCRPMRLRGT